MHNWIPVLGWTKPNLPRAMSGVSLACGKIFNPENSQTNRRVTQQFAKDRKFTFSFLLFFGASLLFNHCSGQIWFRLPQNGTFRNFPLCARFFQRSFGNMRPQTSSWEKKRIQATIAEHASEREYVSCVRASTLGNHRGPQFGSNTAL